jgi:hypothetical protein
VPADGAALAAAAGREETSSLEQKPLKYFKK